MTQKTKNQKQRGGRTEKDNKVRKTRIYLEPHLWEVRKRKKTRGRELNSLSHKNSYRGNQDLKRGHQLTKKSKLPSFVYRGSR